LKVVDLYLGRTATPEPSPSTPAMRLQPQELAAFEGTFRSRTEPSGRSKRTTAAWSRIQGLTFALRPVDATHARAVATNAERSTR
jgi:hypothetical protein